MTSNPESRNRLLTSSTITARSGMNGWTNDIEEAQDFATRWLWIYSNPSRAFLRDDRPLAWVLDSAVVALSWGLD